MCSDGTPLHEAGPDLPGEGSSAPARTARGGSSGGARGTHLLGAARLALLEVLDRSPCPGVQPPSHGSCTRPSPAFRILSRRSGSAPGSAARTEPVLEADRGSPGPAANAVASTPRGHARLDHRPGRGDRRAGHLRNWHTLARRKARFRSTAHLSLLQGDPLPPSGGIDGDYAQEVAQLGGAGRTMRSLGRIVRRGDRRFP